MKKCLIPNAVCHHPALLLRVLFPYQVAEELLSLLRRAPSPSFGRRAVPQLDCTGHATKSIHTSCSPFLFSPTPDTSPVFCHLSKTVFIMEISNYILGDPYRCTVKLLHSNGLFPRRLCFTQFSQQSSGAGSPDSQCAFVPCKMLLMEKQT